MKKTAIVLSFLVLITSSCLQAGNNIKETIQDKEKITSINNIENTESHNNPEELSGSETIDNKPNPFYGKTYINIEEIPELKYHQIYCGGWAIGEKNNNNEYYKDDNENVVCIFTEILGHNENGKAIRKLLDTINIGKLKNEEQLSWGDCYQDTIWNPELIAIIIGKDKEYFDKVVKAWRADTETKKIQLIDNPEGIIVYNEGYGLGGE